MKGGDEVSNDKLFKTALGYFLGDLLELVDPELAAELDLSAPELLPPEVVESRIDLSPEEKRRFEELLREHGEEVQEMAVTWEEALAEREAKGRTEGKLTATRQAITLLAKHCFGFLPAGFEENLEAIDDLDRLHEILEQIPDVGSVQALDLSPQQAG